MKFDVYCDESCPDSIATTSPSSKFLSDWESLLPRDLRTDAKDAIHRLRNKHKVGGEFKWNRVSDSRVEFYTELCEWFFAQGENVRFRCIAVDCDKVI